ncbi:MAG: hypothetical protein PVI30_07925 [Myxococcales bacterium]
MAQGALLRFLDLLRQELGADDTRAEVGGRDPDDPRLIWANLGSGWRLVAAFTEPPTDRAAMQRKLDTLVDGFAQTLDQGELPAPPAPPVDSAFRRLDAALEGLRTRTGAVGAVIVDIQSPVLWGSAQPQRHPDDVETLIGVGAAIESARAAGVDLDELLSLEAADLGPRLRDLGVDPERAGMLGRIIREGAQPAGHRQPPAQPPAQQPPAQQPPVQESALRHHLLTCVAVARARKEAGREPEARWAHHEVQFGYFVRSLANIYLLVMVFEGAFSELHVESTVLHALPGIEQLLLSLPPLDPTPKGARVIKFRR